MGQYYKVFNINNDQKLHPHALGDGLKLMEFSCSAYGTLSAMAVLLAKGTEHEGPWAGHRIVVAGDYADEGRWVPESHAAHNLYSYDYRDEGDEDEEGDGDSWVGERFKEVSQCARETVKALFGEAHPMVGESSSLPGLSRLFATDGVFTSFEDMLDAFGVRPQEVLTETISNMQRNLRVAKVTSAVAWGHQPERVTLFESANGEYIAGVEVDFRNTRDVWKGKMRRKLQFPATSAQVRDFFEITSAA